MSLTFTFFNDDAYLYEGAHVYIGDLKDQETEPMAYRIKMKSKEFWLYNGTPKECGRKELLHGTFNGGFGFCSSSGVLRGYNCVCDFERYGICTSKFKFVDGHTGKKYKWKTSLWTTGWELKDPDGKVVATFERYKRTRTRQGRLTIHPANIPEHLLALILVTQKLVHSGVRAREQQWELQMATA